MSEPAARTGDAPGGAFRIWEKGEGAPLGFLAGLFGLPRWPEFLDRLAVGRRVAAPSLPGFPGGNDPERLDDHLDWALAARDVLHGAGLDGADLIGASAGAALAADVAAIWPEAVRRLVLISPLGMFDPAEPTADVFAQRPGVLSPLVSEKPEALDAWLAVPEGGDALEWDIEALRAATAAARFLWPLCDTRLAKRLGRIACPTLIVRGAADRVVPASYPERFAAAIAGPTKIVTVPGAGHTAELDAPEAVAEAVAAFLDD